MESVCSCCGYRSAYRPFFRIEKIGFPHGRKVFCAGCGPKKPSQGKSAGRSWSSPAVIAISVVLGVAFAKLFPGDVPTFLGALIAFAPITVIAHEIGHATAATLVGMKLVSIEIGTGPVLLSFRWRDISTQLCAFVVMGGLTKSYHRAPRFAKWREGLMLLGGVAANTVIALGALAFRSRYAAGSTAHVAINAVIASQVLVVALNLYPRDFRWRDGMWPSDGKRLWRLLKWSDFPRRAMDMKVFFEISELLEKNLCEEACRRYEIARPEPPVRGVLFSNLLDAIERVKGSRASVEYFIAHSDLLDPKNETDSNGVGHSYNNAAWYALSTGDSRLLPIADLWSKVALELLPDLPAMQGTRGAVLVELGEYEPGLALLTTSIRGADAPLEKAAGVPFLARGERARGNLELAGEFDNLGRYLLNSHPESLRVPKAVETSPPIRPV